MTSKFQPTRDIFKYFDQNPLLSGEEDPPALQPINLGEPTKATADIPSVNINTDNEAGQDNQEQTTEDNSTQENGDPINIELPQVDIELPQADIELPTADVELPQADIELPPIEAELDLKLPDGVSIDGGNLVIDGVGSISLAELGLDNLDLGDLQLGLDALDLESLILDLGKYAGLDMSYDGATITEYTGDYGQIKIGDTGLALDISKGLTDALQPIADQVLADTILADMSLADIYKFAIDPQGFLEKQIIGNVAEFAGLSIDFVNGLVSFFNPDNTGEENTRNAIVLALNTVAPGLGTIMNIAFSVATFVSDLLNGGAGAREKQELEKAKNSWISSTLTEIKKLNPNMSSTSSQLVATYLNNFGQHYFKNDGQPKDLTSPAFYINEKFISYLALATDKLALSDDIPDAIKAFYYSYQATNSSNEFERGAYAMLLTNLSDKENIAKNAISAGVAYSSTTSLYGTHLNYTSTLITLSENNVPQATAHSNKEDGYSGVFIVPYVRDIVSGSNTYDGVMNEINAKIDNYILNIARLEKAIANKEKGHDTYLASELNHYKNFLLVHTINAKTFFDDTYSDYNKKQKAKEEEAKKQEHRDNIKKNGFTPV